LGAARREHHRAESVLPAYRDLCLRVRQRVGSFHADLHLQAERARLLQDEMAAQLATATNRNLFVLTVVTTGPKPQHLVASGIIFRGLSLDIPCVYPGCLSHMETTGYKRKHTPRGTKMAGEVPRNETDVDDGVP
jgi:hypothetical protein